MESKQKNFTAIRSYCIAGVYEKYLDGLSITDIINIQNFYCNTPKGHEVDHIFPLSRGGRHHISNLRYLPKKENRSKFNKIPSYIHIQKGKSIMEVKVKYKTIWGKDRFQPLNDTALLIAQFTGKKTLTREQLIICKKLGFQVIIPNMNVQKYLSDDFEK